MNDVTQLESDLKALRPARPSSGLMVRIEMALADAGKVRDNVITPHRFRVAWIGLGLGLAVAATFLVLANINFHPASKSKVALATPSLLQSAAQLPNYEAAGLTQVVYKQRDEGLFFPASGEAPVRRVRTSTRETWQWQDRHTGARLKVSYPAEEVVFVPVSGQ
jgi:hypothetical protein